MTDDAQRMGERIGLVLRFALIVIAGVGILLAALAWLPLDYHVRATLGVLAAVGFEWLAVAHVVRRAPEW